MKNLLKNRQYNNVVAGKNNNCYYLTVQGHETDVSELVGLHRSCVYMLRLPILSHALTPICQLGYREASSMSTLQ